MKRLSVLILSLILCHFAAAQTEGAATSPPDTLTRPDDIVP